MHGKSVVVVSDLADSGQEGDALATARDGLALLIRTADCAPLAFASAEGVVGVVHGGWRGLAAGVLAEAASTMRGMGATQIHGGLGPCIHPCCYSFGAEDLDTVAAVFGETVRGEDSNGHPALDLPAAVRAAAERADVELIFESGSCTGCESERFWSHRVRREVERQGVLAWLN